MVELIKKTIKNKEYLLVILIVLLAFVFRFYKLTEFPVHLSMDEVAIGYSAYSVLQTGRDEWGEFLPLAFRSVGDYKPPVNVYLSIPSIFVLGLNEFAVRLPTALLGSLSVLVFILFLKEIGFKKNGYLFAGFWLAILPWHVHFSRGGFEAITALFFLLLGILLFQKAIKKTSYYFLSISLISFSISVWAYHAERFFVPVLFVFLLATNRSEILKFFKNKTNLALSLLPFLILMSMFLHISIFTPAVRERAASTSIFREQGLISQLRHGEYDSLGEFVFENDIYTVFRHFMGKYLNYYDLRFWFWKGMQFTPPDHIGIGLMYTVDLLLLLIGIYALSKKSDYIKKITAFWFFVGPIPASFTMNEQHPLRALIWIPFFGLIVAASIDHIMKSKWMHKNKLIFLYFALLFFNVLYFQDVYTRQFPRFQADALQYGFKEASLYACKNRNKYDGVYISETFGKVGPIFTGLPEYYIRFYCVDDFGISSDYDNINIRRIQWISDIIPKDSLIIGSYWDLHSHDIPEHMIIKKIDYPDGSPGFAFVDTTEVN